MCGDWEELRRWIQSWSDCTQLNAFDSWKINLFIFSVRSRRDLTELRQAKIASKLSVEWSNLSRARKDNLKKQLLHIALTNWRKLGETFCLQPKLLKPDLGLDHEDKFDDICLDPQDKWDPYLTMDLVRLAFTISRYTKPFMNQRVLEWKVV